LGNTIPMLDMQSESLFELMKQRIGRVDFEPSALKLGYKRHLRRQAEFSLRDVPLGKLEMFAREGSIDHGKHNPVTSVASEGSLATGCRRLIAGPLILTFSPGSERSAPNRSSATNGASPSLLWREGNQHKITSYCCLTRRTRIPVTRKSRRKPLESLKMDSEIAVDGPLRARRGATSLALHLGAGRPSLL
jgi:hypothetical protein